MLLVAIHESTEEEATTDSLLALFDPASCGQRPVLYSRNKIEASYVASRRALPCPGGSGRGRSGRVGSVAGEEGGTRHMETGTMPSRAVPCGVVSCVAVS